MLLTANSSEPYSANFNLTAAPTLFIVCDLLGPLHRFGFNEIVAQLLLFPLLEKFTVMINHPSGLAAVTHFAFMQPNDFVTPPLNCFKIMAHEQKRLSCMPQFRHTLFALAHEC